MEWKLNYGTGNKVATTEKCKEAEKLFKYLESKIESYEGEPHKYEHIGVCVCGRPPDKCRADYSVKTGKIFKIWGIDNFLWFDEFDSIYDNEGHCGNQDRITRSDTIEFLRAFSIQYVETDIYKAIKKVLT